MAGFNKKALTASKVKSLVEQLEDAHNYRVTEAEADRAFAEAQRTAARQADADASVNESQASVIAAALKVLADGGVKV